MPRQRNPPHARPLKWHQELFELTAFFKQWYGLSWASSVMEKAPTIRNECNDAQNGRRAFKPTLLPRLRALKERILADIPREPRVVTHIVSPRITGIDGE